MRYSKLYILILVLAYNFLFLQIAFAEISINKPPDYERLADCIHRVENGTWPDKAGKGEQYGIHSVHYSSFGEARAICVRTCVHTWQDWAKKGIRMPYLDYLSRHYCPVNHKVWLKNVSYYYNKGGV